MKVRIAVVFFALSIVPAFAVTGEQLMNSCVGSSSDDRELCWGYISGFVEGATIASGEGSQAKKCYEGRKTAIAVFRSVNKLAQTRDLSGAKPATVIEQAWRSVCEPN